MLRFRAKHFAKNFFRAANFLRGLHAFESTKVDFPYQTGTSVPIKVRATYACLFRVEWCSNEEPRSGNGGNGKSELAKSLQQQEAVKQQGTHT
jgi:hypothetical protein